MRFGEAHGIARERVVERRRHVLAVPLHARVLVGARVEARRDEHERAVRRSSGGGKEASSFGEQDLVLFVVQLLEVGLGAVVIQMNYEGERSGTECSG